MGRGASFATWFLGALVMHDFVLLPLYSLAGIGAARLTRADRAPAPRAGAPPPPSVLALNHLRVPGLISALTFLLFFPLILQRTTIYPGATGLSSDVFLGRWVLLTAALFAFSGLLYAIRLGRSRAAYRFQ
jgi:hypothetical protein